LLNIGVPQGSVLGPILFLVYVNDLVNVSKLFSCVLFADDTTLSLSQDDYASLALSVNSELKKIEVWTQANRLSLNVRKTFYMVFSNRDYDCANHPIFFNSQLVNRYTEGKFLGLIMDSRLNFTKHINIISGKISKYIGILYRIRNFVPYNLLINLYYSLVQPYLLYCNLIWGGTYGTHLLPLEILQKKIIRIINGESYLAHTASLFHRANILKLADLHKFVLAVHMFKCKKKIMFNMLLIIIILGIETIFYQLIIG
jgi:hypothetical protein